MCFSATASFSAGVVLLATGALTLKSVSRKCDVPFAAIPLLFAIQQFSEGIIWLSFSHDAVLLNMVMTYVFTFFSHVLWPIYIPVAVILMEPPGWRRRTLFLFVVAGAMVSLYLFYYQIFYRVASAPIGHHILYIAPHFYVTTVITLYLLSCTVSAFFSSYRIVNLFGFLSLMAFIVAYYFYTAWFVSVWCFFCALLSIVIYFQIRSVKKSHWPWKP